MVSIVSLYFLFPADIGVDQCGMSTRDGDDKTKTPMPVCDVYSIKQCRFCVFAHFETSCSWVAYLLHYI